MMPCPAASDASTGDFFPVNWPESALTWESKPKKRVTVRKEVSPPESAAAMSMILMAVVIVAYIACAKWLKMERT